MKSAPIRNASDPVGFIIRTEDILADQIRSLFVPTPRDEQLIELIKSQSPIVLEGSRGTGKSFLLKISEIEQLDAFAVDRTLPVYVSFIKGSLLNTTNGNKLRFWMLAKLASRILRTLKVQGLTSGPVGAFNVLAGGSVPPEGKNTVFENMIETYELSYKNSSEITDENDGPDLQIFKDAIEDICKACEISRINVLFDEAAHIFRPEQQRQFFTLFRDLRSPYMTCNAAVYPGVTAYGSSFEATHDARIEQVNRDIHDPDYLGQMRQIVERQAGPTLIKDIASNTDNFNALAYAVCGNPRLLLKTVSSAGRLRKQDVETELKNFYRTAIWSEHTALAGRYPGHTELIDWGRRFVDDVVINDAVDKNEKWKKEAKSTRTCYFWVQRDAPEAAIEALRLLTYTGVIVQIDSGIVATRKEVGNRYAINVGCLGARSSNPIESIREIRQGLTIKRFTEYGKNHYAFIQISNLVGMNLKSEIANLVPFLFKEQATRLDISEHQQAALKSLGIQTVGQAFNSTEATFQKADYIGPVRSRQMMNVITAAVLEFLSG